MKSRVYELGRVLSRTMPQNPFGDAPVDMDYLPTRGIPFTRHAGNGEVFSGAIGSQGTQFDALGHFGVLDAPWTGTEPFPAEQVTYYNGFTQTQVKPSADGPLLKLGVDKSVPVMTSAVMLDAVAYRGEGTIVKEQSFVLVLLYPYEAFAEGSRRIERIRALYKEAFDQESVLRVDDPFIVWVSF